MEIALTCFDAMRYILGLFAAEWIFVHGAVPMRSRFPRRACLMVLVVVVITVIQAFSTSTFIEMGLTIVPLVTILTIWNLLIVPISAICLMYCYDMTATNAFSRCLMGISLERLTTIFLRNWLFARALPSFDNDHPVWYMVIVLLTYVVVYELCRRLLVPHFRKNIFLNDTENKRFLIVYLGVYFLFALLNNFSVMTSDWALTRVTAQIGVNAQTEFISYFSISMMVIMAMVVFFFQYAIYAINSLKQETLLLSHVMEEKARQYAVSSENIALINQKCHDLKHQLSALNFADDARRQAMVDETQNAVMIYDAAVKTGNDALDTLLTEKSLFCVEHKIRLSCTINTHDLHKIDVVDLYTMLGNALDNAIECVQSIENPDKRVISLVINQHSNILLITVDNYFEGTLEMNDQLPRTSKRDKHSHGFGLKSIRMIAKKYSGDIRVSAEANAFTLTISLVV